MTTINYERIQAIGSYRVLSGLIGSYRGLRKIKNSVTKKATKEHLTTRKKATNLILHSQKTSVGIDSPTAKGASVAPFRFTLFLRPKFNIMVGVTWGASARRILLLGLSTRMTSTAQCLTAFCGGFNFLAKGTNHEYPIQYRSLHRATTPQKPHPYHTTALPSIKTHHPHRVNSTSHCAGGVA